MRTASEVAETAWRGREGGHVCSSAAFHSGGFLAKASFEPFGPCHARRFWPRQVPPASQTSMRPVPSLNIAWAASGDGHVCSAHLAMALSPFGPPPGDRCTSVSYLYLRQSVFAGRSRGNLSATPGLRQVRHPWPRHRRRPAPRFRRPERLRTGQTRAKLGMVLVDRKRGKRFPRAVHAWGRGLRGVRSGSRHANQLIPWINWSDERREPKASGPREIQRLSGTYTTWRKPYPRNSGQYAKA